MLKQRCLEMKHMQEAHFEGKKARNEELSASAKAEARKHARPVEMKMSSCSSIFPFLHLFGQGT